MKPLLPNSRERFDGQSFERIQVKREQINKIKLELEGEQTTISLLVLVRINLNHMIFAEKSLERKYIFEKKNFLDIYESEHRQMRIQKKKDHRAEGSDCIRL